MISDQEHHQAYEFTRLIWVDYAGVRRCRVVPRKRFDDVSFAENGVALARACLFLPSWGDAPPDHPLSSATGEIRMIPDLETLVPLPWNPSERMVLVNMEFENGEEVAFCPRTLLQRALKNLEEETGLRLMAGFESEFTLFNAPRPGDPKSKTLPSPVDTSVYCETSSFNAASPVLGDICTALEQLGQTVEQVHPESGPGQFEIAVEYSDALHAADSLIFRKETISSVAAQHGMAASVLPKLYEDQAGNGCHVHLSLVDAVLHTSSMGRPASDQRKEGSHGLSSLGEAFTAGILKHLQALMPFLAANPNSYHRIKPQCWSGAYTCWGINNRETPIRLIEHPVRDEYRNIELKTLDGTANPYLALAAIVAAGLSGIRQGLSLPEPVVGDPHNIGEVDREKQEIFPLASTLQEALEGLDDDEEFRTILEEITGTGEHSVCDIYSAVKISESKHISEELEKQVMQLWNRF